MHGSPSRSTGPLFAIIGRLFPLPRPGTMIKSHRKTQRVRPAGGATTDLMRQFHVAVAARSWSVRPSGMRCVCSVWRESARVRPHCVEERSFPEALGEGKPRRWMGTDSELQEAGGDECRGA